MSLLGLNARRAKILHDIRVDAADDKLYKLRKTILRGDEIQLLPDAREELFKRIDTRANAIIKAKNNTTATRLGTLAGLAAGGYALNDYLKSGPKPYQGPYRRYI